MPLSHLKDLLRQNKRALVLPEGQEARTWQAVDLLLQEELVEKIWLLGSLQELSEFKRRSKFPNDPRTIFVSQELPDAVFKTQLALLEHARAKGKNLTEATAKELSESPLYQGAWMVRSQLADAGLAGAVYNTADVIRAGLGLIGLKEGIGSISSSFLMVRPGPPPLLWLYTDCGVIIDPTPTQLADMAASSLETWAQVSNKEPVVAFLSFSSKGSAQHPFQEKVATGYKLFRERYPEIQADGELQFDAAFDSAIGLRKAPESKVPGRANIFVFPNLDAGNIAYKITQRLGGFDAWGPILQGFHRPWSDLSRGASPSDIAASAIINLGKSL